MPPKKDNKKNDKSDSKKTDEKKGKKKNDKNDRRKSEKDDKKNRSDSKGGDKKSGAKALPKGAGMGGTIGLPEKPIKICPPKCDPPYLQTQCCPPVECPRQPQCPPPNCPRYC